MYVSLASLPSLTPFLPSPGVGRADERLHGDQVRQAGVAPAGELPRDHHGDPPGRWRQGPRRQGPLDTPLWQRRAGHGTFTSFKPQREDM